VRCHTKMLVGTGVGLVLLGRCSGKTDQAAGTATSAAASTPAALSPRKPKGGLWTMTINGWACRAP
jgi:hypothetical protein